LVSPSTTTFTTGGGADLTAPQVNSVSPASGATGVPTNTVVQLQFSKRIDPLTVTSSTFYVYPQNTGVEIAGVITVSPDGLSAAFAPNVPLAKSTGYTIQASAGILDLEGQALPSYTASFTTGTQ
jgi:hypothetical protein